jgi:tetratricopeptide (TPR) repeat protein
VSGALPVRAAALLLALALGACATTGETPEPPRAGVTPPAPTGALRSGPASTDPRGPLVARHVEQAAALERAGDLRRAMDELKVALTIRPGDDAAAAALKTVEAKIEGQVAERIRAGRAALARGVQAEARRQFLAALALDPANRAAFDALQSDTKEAAFMTHTVRSGDTLAALAQRYYGDRSRSEVIWETNQLPPNPRLVAGTILKIPEIPGVPFVQPEVKRPAAASPATPAPATPKAEPPVKEEIAEVNPLLAEAREALDRKDWSEALSDADRFLASSPGNADGIAVKKQALYQQGKTQLDSRRYTESYRALVQLARLQPDYEDSAKLLQQARTRAIEQHYTQGLRLFQEEKLAEAISEWRVVLDLDPQHANAKKNLDQAEKLQKALDQRKKK